MIPPVESRTEWRVIQGDCIEVMAGMDAASIAAIVTDPPYGIHFMGKSWDGFGGPLGRGVGSARGGGRERGGAMAAGEYDLRSSANREFQAWCERWARECLRVLRPGGHLLSFGSTRTYHRMASGVEDAGFEIRDTIAWLYGSGFPKSLDVGKAIGKAGGRWDGWGTALKPAFEPIMVARKSLTGTVAANVTAHGTGALNVDGCRVVASPSDAAARAARNGATDATPSRSRDTGWGMNASDAIPRADVTDGRWPANVVLDEEAAAMLDEQSGELVSGTAVGGLHRRSNKTANCYGEFRGERTEHDVTYGDSGGASRFFYVAKTSSTERGADNTHPTVKPRELMRWLVRLVTPQGGTVLDPFAGSGTTGIAALREGFSFIGIEREVEYVAIARARIIGDAPLFNAGMEAT